MSKATRLADYDHPLVSATAHRLAEGESSTRRRIERLFHYVRDDIAFGFPDAGDLVKASQTIAIGLGQCNTKTTLFLALCKALGIPARVHFSLIRKEIQKGLFTGLAYRLMPPLLSHSWLEVQVDGAWRRLDSYVNDEPFYEAGKRELGRCGWDTGYSIACARGESSAAFNLDTEKFVQMDAVVDDHGVWDDPADYYASAQYKNRPGVFKLLLYRLLVSGINRRVRAIRESVAPSPASAHRSASPEAQVPSRRAS